MRSNCGLKGKQVEMTRVGSISGPTWVRRDRFSWLSNYNYFALENLILQVLVLRVVRNDEMTEIFRNIVSFRPHFQRNYFRFDWHANWFNFVSFRSKWKSCRFVSFRFKIKICCFRFVSTRQGNNIFRFRFGLFCTKRNEIVYVLWLKQKISAGVMV